LVTKSLRKVQQKIYRRELECKLWIAVRVKWCGKSAPRAEQSVRRGKPHAEQDQIGEEERPVPINSRVGRSSRSAMNGLDEWLLPERVQKPAYSPAGCVDP